MKDQHKSKEQLIDELIDLRKKVARLEKLGKRRKRREKKFRKFLESAPDALVVTSDRGKIMLVNAQTEKLFGYSRSELIGKSVEMLLPKQSRASHKRQRKDYALQPYTRPMGAGMDLFGQHKDGTVFTVEVSLSPMQTEEGMWISCNIRDISQRKMIEQEERQRLIKEFEAANEGLKILRGILSVCSSCKKVREDDGSWKNIEKYICDHSEAVFSHGICPKCFEKLYPQFYEEFVENGNG
ncbi:MAG: PAS domain S-box protein [Calditrichaeota bacterium]|nr:PAS domain S-box protein [Calditrichota bacterium]